MGHSPFQDFEVTRQRRPGIGGRRRIHCCRQKQPDRNPILPPYRRNLPEESLLPSVRKIGKFAVIVQVDLDSRPIRSADCCEKSLRF